MFQITASLVKKILFGKVLEISLEKALTYGKENWLNLVITDIILFLLIVWFIKKAFS
jgi:hypothetical protein